MQGKKETENYSSFIVPWGDKRQREPIKAYGDAACAEQPWC
jgi:hypothetical protein